MGETHENANSDGINRSSGLDVAMGGATQPILHLTEDGSLSPGSQVVGWINEDELPENYPYDAIYPFSKVDGVRLFPVFAPQNPRALSHVMGRIAELEAALQPFARIADMEERAGAADSVMVNVARCRDARAALATKEASDV